MEILFVAEKVHKRKLFSVYAYQLIFTDTQIYFICLGEDSSKMPFGTAAGGLAGAITQSIANKISEKTIDKKLKEIEDGHLDKLIINDKRSFKARYAQLESFETKAKTASVFSDLSYVKFGVREKGKHKFTFDTDEPRQAVEKIIRQKRPDLMK